MKRITRKRRRQLLTTLCGGLLASTMATAESPAEGTSEAPMETGAVEAPGPDAAPHTETPRSEATYPTDAPVDTLPSGQAQEHKLVWPSEKDVVISEMPGPTEDLPGEAVEGTGETEVVEPLEPDSEVKKDHE